MIVKELIKQLQLLDPELRVFAGTGDEYSNEILQDTGVRLVTATVAGADQDQLIVVVGNGDGPLAKQLSGRPLGDCNRVRDAIDAFRHLHAEGDSK